MLCCHGPLKGRLCRNSILCILKDFSCFSSVTIISIFFFVIRRLISGTEGLSFGNLPLLQIFYVRSTLCFRHNRPDLYNHCVCPSTHCKALFPRAGLLCLSLVFHPRQRHPPQRSFTMGRPSDFGPILNGVMWLQVIISSILIVLRIYTRYYIIRSLGWDDYMMVINLVSHTLSTALSLHLIFPPGSEPQRGSLTMTGYIHCFYSYHLGWCLIWGWEEDRRHRTSWSGQLKSHLLGGYRPGYLYRKSSIHDVHTPEISC